MWPLDHEIADRWNYCTTCNSAVAAGHERIHERWRMSEHRITTMHPFRYDENEPVYMDGERLDLDESLRVFRHSPNGFAWGYGGSGPAQLALAILLRLTEPEIAVRHHQAFKWQYVATWPQHERLDAIVNVDDWLRVAEAARL